MGTSAKSWLKQGLRWCIAIFGIGYVLNNMSWSNQVLVPGPGGWPVATRLASGSINDDASQFTIVENDGTTRTVLRGQLLVKVNFVRVKARINGEIQSRELLAQRLTDHVDRARWPYVVCRPRNLWQRLWKIRVSDTEMIEPAQIVGAQPTISQYPLIDPGIGPMLHQSKFVLLLASFLILPITTLITSYRWHELLKTLEIYIGYAKCLVLNLIGAFYSTFVPGSISGEMFKALYVAQLTPQRTRAMVSIVADRVIGLLALVVLAGVMSVVGLYFSGADDAARQPFARCALGSLLICGGTAAGLLIFYTPVLRRHSGLDWLIRRFPMQQRVQNAIEALEMLKRYPRVVLWAFIVSLPIHAIVVASATLVGKAFNLPLHSFYYWIVIPVLALAASIPISPQGVGVIELFAILLTRRQGCTVSQVFALTMCMRIIGTFWCLPGGLFVIRGGVRRTVGQSIS